MAVLYLNEKTLEDKRVSVNQEARTIQYSIYRITIVNDVLCMQKVEKLLEQAEKNDLLLLYVELSQQYETTIENNTKFNLEVKDSLIEELPIDFVDKIGLGILKDYKLTKEITNITIRQK